jgi:3-carboxy-cis,cis-muconate cycloisomerase
MTSTMIDSSFLQDLYGTAEMRAVFSSAHLLQKWLDVEAALAQAEADFGIIPAEAAAEITRQARAERLDGAQIKLWVDQTVHPIVPVIRALQAACQSDAGEYIHWGATTQDIMDTAIVLQLKEALAIIRDRLNELSITLASLARAHRDTLMPGRTHGQHALPITFGYKAAVWLSEIQRHISRLDQLEPRLLIGQLGGAAGTLASLGEQALQVQQRMMEILGLKSPLITWHTARDNLAEYASLLAMIAATLGKIAHEIISLQHTELAEIEEPFYMGKVGSSTMPHKRNPMICEAILALSRLVLRLAPSAWDAMIQEHERDWSSDHIEWAYLPEISIYTDGALSLTIGVMGKLQVYPDRMQKNLEITRGLILSEALMLALSQHIGRQSAHEIVYRCSMQAHDEHRSFAETLSNDLTVNSFLTAEQISVLLKPSNYTGLAGVFVDRVLENANDHSE